MRQVLPTPAVAVVLCRVVFILGFCGKAALARRGFREVCLGINEVAPQGGLSKSPTRLGIPDHSFGFPARKGNTVSSSLPFYKILQTSELLRASTLIIVPGDNRLYTAHYLCKGKKFQTEDNQNLIQCCICANALISKSIVFFF